MGFVVLGEDHLSFGYSWWVVLASISQGFKMLTFEYFDFLMIQNTSENMFLFLIALFHNLLFHVFRNSTSQFKASLLPHHHITHHCVGELRVQDNLGQEGLVGNVAAALSTFAHASCSS